MSSKRKNSYDNRSRSRSPSKKQHSKKQNDQKKDQAHARSRSSSSSSYSSSNSQSRSDSSRDKGKKSKHHQSSSHHNQTHHNQQQHHSQHQTQVNHSSQLYQQLGSSSLSSTSGNVNRGGNSTVSSGMGYLNNSSNTQFTHLGTNNLNGNPAAVLQPPQPVAYKAKNNESPWLYIRDIAVQLDQKYLEQIFYNFSIECSTSMPDEVRYYPMYQSAIVVYPSASAASKVLYHLQGLVQILGYYFPMDFYPSGQVPGSSGGAGSGVSGSATNIGSHGSSAFSYEIASDWICDQCDFKNFARRMKCQNCDKPKSANCVNLPTIASKPITPGSTGSTAALSIVGSLGANLGLLTDLKDSMMNQPNTSLMVRGNIVMNITEQQLFDVFSRLAPVKDIRTVSNKSTGQMKDFAFVQFYTLEEAEAVLKVTQISGFTICGEQVQVFFSKNRRGNEDSKNQNNNSSGSNNTNSTSNNMGSGTQQAPSSSTSASNASSSTYSINSGSTNNNLNSVHSYKTLSSSNPPSNNGTSGSQQANVYSVGSTTGHSNNSGASVNNFYYPNLPTGSTIGLASGGISQLNLSFNTHSNSTNTSSVPNATSGTSAYQTNTITSNSSQIINASGGVISNSATSINSGSSSRNDGQSQKSHRDETDQSNRKSGLSASSGDALGTMMFSKQINQIQNQSQQMNAQKQKTEDLKEKIDVKALEIQKQQQTKKQEEAQQQLDLQKLEKQKIKQFDQDLKKLQQTKKFINSGVDNFDKTGSSLEQRSEKLIMFICSICKRQFNNEETLRYHDSFSNRHLENLQIVSN